MQAIRDGAREFLPLPPDPDLIAAILEAASGDGHAMVVRDPAMAAAVRRAEQVAASDASVARALLEQQNNHPHNLTDAA